MSCTFGCILEAECARTSQPEPIIAGANRWKTDTSGAGRTLSRRRFQPLTHSSVSNCNEHGAFSRSACLAQDHQRMIWIRIPNFRFFHDLSAV